jgi:hypothetical protein
LFGPVNVLRLQAAQFADAQGAGINGFEDRLVPITGQRRLGAALLGSLARRQQLEGGRQQVRHLLSGQELWQPLSQLRQHDVADGRGLDLAATERKR